ncbi:MAG: hypothetical protein KatS3mg087_1051 [Patescibacteria group bacterium]|nr:MAG: hypothetical protein KatS3mg087_1051 [Patescibacteria group bacterium]
MGCPNKKVWNTSVKLAEHELRRGNFLFGDIALTKKHVPSYFDRDSFNIESPKISYAYMPHDSLPPHDGGVMFYHDGPYYDPSAASRAHKPLPFAIYSVGRYDVIDITAQKSPNIQRSHIHHHIRVAYNPGTAIHEIRTNEKLTGIYKSTMDKMEEEVRHFGANFKATVQPIRVLRDAARRLGASFEVWKRSHSTLTKKTMGLYFRNSYHAVTFYYSWVAAVHEFAHHIDNIITLMDSSGEWENLKERHFELLWAMAHNRYNAKWAHKSLSEALSDNNLKDKFKSEGWTTLNELVMGHPDAFDTALTTYTEIYPSELAAIEELYNFIREKFPEIFEEIKQISTLAKKMTRLVFNNHNGWGYLEYVFKSVPEKVPFLSRATEKLATTIWESVSPDTGWAFFTSRLIAETYGIPTWVSRIPIIGPMMQLARIAFDPVYHGAAMKELRKTFKTQLHLTRALSHYAYVYPSKEAQQALYSVEDNGGWYIYYDAFVDQNIGHVEEMLRILSTKYQNLLDEEVRKLKDNDKTNNRPLKTDDEYYQRAEQILESTRIWQMDGSPTWGGFIYAARVVKDTIDYWKATGVSTARTGSYVLFDTRTLAKIKQQFIAETGNSSIWEMFLYWMQLRSYVQRAKAANDKARARQERPPITDDEIKEYENHRDAVFEMTVKAIQAEKENITEDQAKRLIESYAEEMRLFYNTYLTFALVSNTLNLPGLINILEWHKDTYVPLVPIDIEAAPIEEDLTVGLGQYKRPDIRAVLPKVPLGRAFVPRGPWKSVETETAKRVYGAYTAMYTAIRNHTIISVLTHLTRDIKTKLQTAKGRERVKLENLLGVIKSLYIPVTPEWTKRTKVSGKALGKYAHRIIDPIIQALENAGIQVSDALKQQLIDALKDQSIREMAIVDVMVSVPNRVGLIAVPNLKTPSDLDAYISDVWNYDYYVITDAFLYKLLVNSPAPLDILQQAAETRELLKDLPQIYGEVATPYHQRFRRLVTRNVRYLISNVPRDMLSAMLFGKGYKSLVPLLPLINGIYRLWHKDTSKQLRAIDTYVQSYRERMLGREAPTWSEIGRLYWAGEPDLAWDGIKRWIAAEFPGTRKITAAKIPFIVLSAIGWPIELSQRMMLYLVNLSTKISFKLAGYVYPHNLNPDVTPEIFELAARTWAYEEEYRKTHDHVLSTFEQDWITGTFSTHGTNFVGRWLSTVPFANAFFQIAIRMPLTLATSANPDDQLKFFVRIAYLFFLAICARYFWWLMYGKANGDEELTNQLEKIQNLPTEAKVRFSHWGPFRIPNDEFVPGLIMGLANEVVDDMFLSNIKDVDTKKQFNDYVFWRTVDGLFNNIITGFPVIGRVLSPEVKTFIEVMQNYSFLYHREIIPMYLKDLPPEFIVPHDSSKSIEEMAKFLRTKFFTRVSPTGLDYVVRGVYGSHSRALIELIGHAMYKDENLAKAFVEYVTGSTTKNLEPYGRFSLGYTALEDFEREYQTIKKYIELSSLRGVELDERTLSKWATLSAGHALFWKIESHIRKIYELRKYGGDSEEIINHQKEAARLSFIMLKLFKEVDDTLTAKDIKEIEQAQDEYNDEKTAQMLQDVPELDVDDPTWGVIYAAIMNNQR